MSKTKYDIGYCFRSEYIYVDYIISSLCSTFSTFKQGFLFLLLLILGFVWTIENQKKIFPPPPIYYEFLWCHPTFPLLTFLPFAILRY